jgi:hypothetical protein
MAEPIELRPPKSLEAVAMAHWLLCGPGVRPAWWEPGSTDKGGYWCLVGVGRCVWPHEMPGLGYSYLDRAVWPGDSNVQQKAMADAPPLRLRDTAPRDGSEFVARCVERPPFSPHATYFWDIAKWSGSHYASRSGAVVIAWAPLPKDAAGACDHDFSDPENWRALPEGRVGGERVCLKCGMGALQAWSDRLVEKMKAEQRAESHG